MAQLGMVFDANAVEPTTGSLPVVPPGKYVVHIVSSEMYDTKLKPGETESSGKFLQLDMDILEGPEAGNRLVDRLNLINSNAKAVQIAQGTLSAICRAVGVMAVSDSEQLHGRRMVADVRVEPAKGEYGPSNRIASYAPWGAVAQAQPVKQTPAPVVKNAATGTNPPWRR